MKARVLMAAMAAVLGGNGAALADDGARLEATEQRLRYLEQRLQAQAEAERAKDARIAELEKTAGGDSWLSRVTVGGLIEVEASYAKADGDDATSDLTVATVELGFAAQVNDWVGAEAVLLYEGEGTDVDVAQITVAPPEGPWSVTAGRLYLPFGGFETHMVSDPLTLEIGETAEDAVVAGVESNGLSAAAYVFNGRNDDGADRIDNFGLALGYGVEGDGYAVNAGLGYINDLSDSDALQDAIASNSGVDYAAGWTANLVAGIGPVSLIGEYLAAKDAIAGLGGAKPAAWNLEAGYSFHVAGREATMAVGYQGTSDAAALDLPERRALAALSVNVLDNTVLSVELARDRAYDGTDSHAATAQVAVQF